jgi:hemerythrin-like domain-containing protein
VTTAPEVPLCDATAMTRFHRIFREALDAVPQFVGAAVADDDDRADLVGSYYANVLKLLHAHHEAEDLTIYPLMVERLPQHVDVISRVNAEHEVVLGTLGAAEQAVAAWRADPSSASRDAAVAALVSLHSILLEHLDHEEADVVPLIALCINVAEWGQMSATAFPPHEALPSVRDGIPALVPQDERHKSHATRVSLRCGTRPSAPPGSARHSRRRPPCLGSA